MSSYITPEQQQAITEDKELDNKSGELLARFIREKLADINLQAWTIDEDGVSQEIYRTDKHGKSVATGNFIYASPIPIAPIKLYKNKDTDTEKIELAFIKNSRIRSRIVDRRTIASKTKILDLSSYGIEVSDENAKALVKYLFEVINGNRLPYGISSNVMGWYENTENEAAQKCFIPYNGNIQFDGEEQYGTLFKALNAKGAVEEWAEFMQPLRKNTIFRLGMAAAFASPLIELVSANPFIFHLWGNTGIGKTVLLMAAMSIWGNPERGKLTRSLNGTLNSMLSVAAFLRNIPFAGDELQTMKRYFKNYDDMIMCLAEGIDRSRMNSSSELTQTKSWQCSFILTGEEPIIKADSGGGAVNRVIECYATAPIFEDGRKVVAFVKNHYGAAGKKFIEKLAELEADNTLENMYGSYYDYVQATVPDTTEKQIQIMALLLTADEIAKSLFWKDEPSIEVSQVSQFLKTKSEVDVSERAYETIKSVMAINGENFEGTGRECWGKVSEDGTVYFILHKLREVLAQYGFDYKAVRHAWINKGYIKSDLKPLKGGAIKTTTRAVVVLPQAEEPELEEVTDQLPTELS